MLLKHTLWREMCRLASDDRGVDDEGEWEETMKSLKMEVDVEQKRDK